MKNLILIRTLLIIFLTFITLNFCFGQKKKNHAEKAMQLYEGQEYKKAIPVFDKAINSSKRKDHELYQLYFYRAISKSREGEYYGSYTDINNSLKLNPFYAEAYIFRGLLNLLLESEKEALTDFNKATEAEPENFIAWIYVADLYYEMKDYKMASEAYGKVLQIKPDKHEIRTKRADIFYILKQYEEAIKDYDLILEDMPENGDAYFMRGLCKTYITNKDSLGACEDLKKARKLGTNTNIPGLEDYCSKED